MEFAAPFIMTGSTVHVSSPQHSTFSTYQPDEKANIATGYSIEGGTFPKISSKGAVMSITHHGLLTNLQVDKDVQRGELIYRVDLRPTMETWLNRISAFEKYRFRHICFIYKPTVPATVEGGLVGMPEWDVDSLLETGQGEDTLKDALGHYMASSTNIWAPHTWTFANCTDGDQWWYVDDSQSDLRFTTQGVFTIIAAQDGDGDTDIDAGFLEVVYECELAIPETNSTDVGSSWYGNGTGTVGVANLHGTEMISRVITDENNTPHYDLSNNIAFSYEYETNVGYYRLPHGYFTLTHFWVSESLAPVTLPITDSYFGGYYALDDPIEGDFAFMNAEDSTLHTTSFTHALYSPGRSAARGDACFTLSAAGIGATVTKSFLLITKLAGRKPFNDPDRVLIDSLIERIKALENKRTYKEVLLVKPPPPPQVDSSSEDDVNLREYLLMRSGKSLRHKERK